ncbi:MAG: aminodeoxychorismate lyase [Pseudomonadota bacterium]
MSWLFDPPTPPGNDSRALAYGDGVFTTAAIRAGDLLFRDRHIRRLQRGCERLGMLAPTRERIERLVDTSLHQSATRAGMAKVIAYRPGQKRGYRPSANEAPHLGARCYPLVDADEWPELKPMRVGLASMRWAVQPALAGIKHLNRLEQVLAAAEIGTCDDVLCRDTEGQVVSATSANVFAVVADALQTPAVDTAGVAGVTRAAVIAICERDAIPVEITALAHDDLIRCSEMFVTSSRYGIRPVTVFADRDLSVGPVTRDLHRRLLREALPCVG